jgi:hypothetical protein
MRFHNNNSYATEGELDARMNGSSADEPFGVIDLGPSDICLDTLEDAERLLTAAARIVGWFKTDAAPHAFNGLSAAGYGPCAHCGHIKKAERHAEPAPTGEGEGGVLFPADADEDGPTYGAAEIRRADAYRETPASVTA